MAIQSDWFEAARFGMFIHWGLYALPGGRWKGMETPWVSEWVMHRYRIPKAEYEKLLHQLEAARAAHASYEELLQKIEIDASFFLCLLKNF